MTAEIARLTSRERRRLIDEEAVIHRGLGTFMEVGRALAVIRDQRLYRESHATWEAYCEDRWTLGKRRADQLIAAAETGTVVPVSNERQARVLTGLTPEQQQATHTAAQQATGRQQPTAAELTAARQRVAPRSPAPAGLAQPPAGNGSPSPRSTRGGGEPDTPRDPELKRRHTEEQDRATSRRVFSEHLARSVSYLADCGAMDDATGHALRKWEPSVDSARHVPTTAERIRAAARFLLDLARRWEQAV